MASASDGLFAATLSSSATLSIVLIFVSAAAGVGAGVEAGDAHVRVPGVDANIDTRRSRFGAPLLLVGA